MSLTTDAKARKATPIFSGCIMYFPDALAAVAELSRIGNDQHNPGEPLHWARGKSTDELDALSRHLTEAGTYDTDGVLHDAKMAWRALANLQKRLEDIDYDHISRHAARNPNGSGAGQVGHDPRGDGTARNAAPGSVNIVSHRPTCGGGNYW
jgi:hypothetical protein